ncbi:CXXX repeat peptide modification system protein [Clostridium sp. 19966]|uniref:CXXX repeat peptide modification system protein n=1 Tax=Clostridium sp. 19966 TaxID=2768166 RepID=UPI0028DF9E7D|nr:CXXX repeat peptide modification system protein [Clostridium sp. 19966]MDT8719432.1 CXXX repeat peptide modification system protein [Clostridium sp. 19966]
MYRVGVVSEIEKLELMKLYEKKNAIEELEFSINKSDLGEKDIEKIKEKIIIQKPIIVNQFNEWWKSKANKYSWQGKEGGQWRINFDSNEIFLI